ncbi:MAG: hypothetical protein AAF317_13610 [Pseudomonadota bacterium]
MKIWQALTAAGLLSLAPMSANALTSTLFEGTNSNVASGFAMDQLVLNIPGFSSDLNGNVGDLTFGFNTGNYSGTVTAERRLIDGGVSLRVFGTVDVIGAGASGNPLSIVVSQGFFELPFNNVVVSSTGQSSGTNADSLVAMASFISANNNGGLGDATNATTAVANSELATFGVTDSSVLGESFTTTTVPDPVTGELLRPLTRSKQSIIADSDFALNSIIVIDDVQGALPIGSQTFFEFTTVATVPLPAPALLLLSALAGVGFVSRRRKAAA